MRWELVWETLGLIVVGVLLYGVIPDNRRKS